MSSNDDYWKDIQEIMSKSSCTDKVASQAYQKANGKIPEAIKIAKDLSSNELYVGGGSSGLAVQGHDESLLDKERIIVLYKNGFTVDGKFFDLKERKNKKAIEMLARNEFDSDILGGNPDDQARVKLINRADKDYQEEDVCCAKKKQKCGAAKAINTRTLEKIDVPDEIVIDKGGDVVFKILISGKRAKVIVDSDKTVEDVIIFLYKNYVKTAKIFITSNNEKLYNNVKISTLKNTLVVLNQE